jgi:uncharacterized protein (DUF1778 family)
MLSTIVLGDQKMNLHSPRPDRSANAVAERKKIADFARAANMRQGYVNDPVLEAAKARYVIGDLTLDELREETLARFVKA